MSLFGNDTKLEWKGLRGIALAMRYGGTRECFESVNAMGHQEAGLAHYFDPYGCRVRIGSRQASRCHCSN